MAEASSYRRTFWRLLGFLKPYKWSLAVSVVLAVASQAAAVAMAFLTGGGLERAVESDMFTRSYADVYAGDERWTSLDVPEGSDLRLADLLAIAGSIAADGASQGFLPGVR